MAVARNGYFVDTDEHTVGQFGGDVYALDCLNMAPGALYYARQIPRDPFITYQETWLIPNERWAITRFTFHEHLQLTAIDWKLETDWVEIDGPIWRVHDGFLDLELYDGSHYDLADADEFAEALAASEISLDDGTRTLHALDRLCRALRHHGYSGESLLRQYAPELWIEAG
jgi:predicted RNA-binding protein associated with RNAse of E/G family